MVLQKKDIQQLGEKLNYSFKNLDLLEEALRHASYVNELNSNLRDNERLEFLGDAVLDLAVSHCLMRIFNDEKEGVLSKYRAMVVDEKALYQVALKLELGDYILLGRGEEMTGGRGKPSILANTMEAILGALYLDAGFSKTQEVIHELFTPLINNIDIKSDHDDYKSLLQEYTQELHQVRPVYQILDEKGPAHDKTFSVAIHLNGEIIAEGEGKSKKEAEQKAAREAFYCLQKDQKES